MLDDFKDPNEIAFSTICDVQVSELEGELKSNDNPAQTMTVATKKIYGDISNKDVNSLPALKDLEDQVKEERRERNLSINDILFIGIAWIVIPIFRFLQLNPEVIWCDCTSH